MKDEVRAALDVKRVGVVVGGMVEGEQMESEEGVGSGGKRSLL